MIEHHAGAVKMARQERTAGKPAELADAIVRTQRAEIEQMRRGTRAVGRPPHPPPGVRIGVARGGAA